MKKSLRRTVSAILALIALLVTQIPVEQADAAGSLSSTAADFQMNGTILVKYTGTSANVSVPASVTEIAEEAFAGNTEMQKLEFKGDNVEKIAYRAFADCTGLQEIVLPDSVTQIGAGSFAGCSNLKKVTIGTGLSSVGMGAFANCALLKTMTVKSGNSSFTVDDGCLYNSDKTKLYLVLQGREKDSYLMPSTVTDIAPYAFWGNTLKSVGLSSNLKKIPDFAFAGCQSLESVSIPYSVTEISMKAFADCVNLKDVTIPSTVRQIDETAFDGCYRLNILASEDTPAYAFFERFKERFQEEYEDTGISGEEAAETPQENVPQSTPQPVVVDETTGNVLGSTYIVGNNAVVFIDNTKPHVQGNGDLPALPESGDAAGQGTDGEVPSQTDDANYDAQKVYEIPKMTIVNDSIIADLAFYQNRELTSYKIPAGIREIGEFSFARSGLTSITIPDGVKYIDYGAFYHCDYLHAVRIPSSVIYIAPKAFDKTQWMEAWLHSEGDDFLVVGDGILLAYRGKGGAVTIPDNVRRIGSEAFAGNISITSVYIPDSVIEIGEKAFYGCSNLSKITGGTSVTVIRDGAFAGCVPDSAHVFAKVTSLGANAFDFSATSLGDSDKVVVFDMTNKMPAAAHELTAERLSNESARGGALGDARFAVVDKSVKAEELLDTLLMDGRSFTGLIVAITSRDRGEATCLAAAYTPSAYAQAYIPDYITIDGKVYKILGKEEVTVFLPEESREEGIVIHNLSESLQGRISNVSLEGEENGYTLTVTESGSHADSLKEAYEAVYGQEMADSTVFADFTLTDNDSGITVSKFGTQHLRVTVTLPDALRDAALRIYTLDRNGQLESLSYSQNGSQIIFSASHLSPVAFCRVGNTPTGAMDASPDTGDYSIHPKYFLALGLFSLSIAVLFVRKKKKEL